MTNGPYHPGKNKMSATRLNETDLLARKRIRFGSGFKVDDLGRELRVSVVFPGGRGAAEVTASRFGFLRATTLTPLVVVQFLKHAITDDNGQQIGAWSVDGDPRAAWLFPNAQPTDVVQLVRSAFTNTTPIVRLDKINDVWYVTWVPRWSVIQIPQNVPIVRCA